MAEYHKGLKYHEDEIEKHELSQEDIEFLREIQKELNTQDTICQANPRFWVIKGTEKIYRVEDADGYELYDTDYCEIITSSMEEIAEYIKEHELDEICECDGKMREVTYESPTFGFGSGSIHITTVDEDDEYDVILEDLYDIKEWLEENTSCNYEVISYKIVPKIYEDTMFLTQKDAEDHLRANDYHYSDDAHTYAMTAWRSPRVAKLIKILQETEW
jgi:hypothetical protein